LSDPSLTTPELLEGASGPLTFDPRGRGSFYEKDAGSTLVYRDLRTGSGWSTALPPVSDEDKRYAEQDKAVRPIDFYASGDGSGLFRCQGGSLFDYDEAGRETEHKVGVMCPRALYSAADALLVAPGRETYTGVRLGDWRPYSLEAVGTCGAEVCERRLARQIITKGSLVSQPMGDTFVLVGAGLQAYDATTGAEVGFDTLSTPDRGVVKAPGYTLYDDDDRTIAVTEDIGNDTKTTVRYFGPDPSQPQRWLTASFTLEPPRPNLRAKPSDDLKRIVVWSDVCYQGAQKTLLTFEPGQAPKELDLAGCISKMHWVGSEGSLLVELHIPDPEGIAPSRFELRLIHADQRVTPINIEGGNNVGIRQALSNGKTLVVTSGYAGPLTVIDLQTGASRTLAPAVERLFTDRTRERLAFQVASSSFSGPCPLWAGAFPN
jgi:hypothetical protein